jgi:uncharacterized protein (TIGR02246 family)
VDERLAAPARGLEDRGGARLRAAAAAIAAFSPPLIRRALAPAAALLLAACVRVRVNPDAAEAPVAAAQRAAEDLLAHGAAAWNRGDLDGFVSDYAEDATFVTSRGLVRGRAAIRERYAPRFAPGTARDSLSFRDIRARVEGDAVQAVAWWVLSRGDSVTATGPTSLLLRRAGGRWRIVHDHSS